eukprot:347329-Chlamydomonas_euryale.AAC.2
MGADRRGSGAVVDVAPCKLTATVSATAVAESVAVADTARTVKNSQRKSDSMRDRNMNKKRIRLQALQVHALRFGEGCTGGQRDAFPSLLPALEVWRFAFLAASFHNAACFIHNSMIPSSWRLLGEEASPPESGALRARGFEW